VPQAEKTGFTGGTGSGKSRQRDNSSSAKGPTFAAAVRWSLSQVSLKVIVIPGKYESKSSRAGLEKQPQI
jgi:hypothetical protein